MCNEEAMKHEKSLEVRIKELETRVDRMWIYSWITIAIIISTGIIMLGLIITGWL